MSDWTAGYVADIGYTFGYYNELNPLRTRLSLLNAGIVCPEYGTACELGFGQGVSVNLHAAATDVEWCGTDFNPSQAAHAREMAEIAGSNARLFDDAFAEFAQRKDLPDFDYIGLHGIWSWISDENRTVIVDFIGKKLKVGGVVYISYNTLPGWAAFAPMRHLMTEHAEVIGAEGRGIVSRINDAIDFADKLLATNPFFLKANPPVADRIKQLKTQNRHYLAHEYFNRDWHPMHFATMREWLAPAKLQYACSANLVDHIEAVNLTTAQQDFLKEVPDPMFRESVRDFMVNQQFRRDYWIKGVRRLTVQEQTDRLRKVRLILTAHRPDVPLKINGALGEANLQDAVYNPILDVLADHKIRSIGQIEHALKATGISFGHLVQALVVLSGAGHVSVAQDDPTIAKAKKRTEKLNMQLMLRTQHNNDINYLASPVIGGGIAVNKFQQLFLLAQAQGKKEPNEWAAFTWNILTGLGQKIVKEGKSLDSPEANIAELSVQANTFAQKYLPVLKALQIV